ncbi:IPT/TIG domain-containing protein [Methylotuvimicrobium buryatense]|uniref:IPT/TIG domain-containing protein n=1 Tax=Methylotuvimicrobium buryatense TaxID=95641 RepID=A0A4P9UT84_METBY|nr:IPT/TIG domain-containing protein [Methylotuvimicrobium buryatense]QCW83763.1 hypothetical protein EQU24_17050 [Methylotuvimicrobium buryatense]
MKLIDFKKITERTEPIGFAKERQQQRALLSKGYSVFLAGIIFSLLTLEAQAAITSIDPQKAGHGAEIVIEGTGFGSNKPRVTLIESNPAGNRAQKVALRVIANNDTTITAQLKGGKADNYVLEVKSAGTPAIKATQEFTIAAPENLMLSAEQGEVNDEIEVSGDFFGNRRPQVFIGGKKAKITDFGEDFAVIRIPRIANGLHEVTVRNRAGDSVSSTLFEVINSPVKLKKQHRLNVKFAGKNYSVAGMTLNAVYSPVTKQITIMALKVSGMSVSNLTLTGQVDLGNLPAAIGPGFGPGDIIYQIPNVTGNSQYQSENNSDEWRIIFHQYENGYLYGSFSGFLRNSLNKNEKLQMSSGTFTVKVLE